MAESGSDKSGGRGVPDGLKEAIEGAFAATERTRAQAQELTEKTRSRAQGLVDEVTRRGSDARGTLEGLRLVSRDELRQLEERIDEISSRLAELERKSKAQPEG
jgi:polyhydroxyalkanoate synthesis regulator phasin